nr:Sft2d1 protein [Danio rerio]
MDKLRRVLSGREENEEMGLTAQDYVRSWMARHSVSAHG